MFSLAFTYRFEAAHRFTHSESEACMTPHGHSWHATLHLRATNHADAKRRQLDAAGMVVEFSRVKSAWKRTLDDTLDHSFFANHQDPLLEAMRDAIPNLREVLFPGDPTTEMLALLLATKAQQILAHIDFGGDPPVEVAQVQVQETETNAVTFAVQPNEVLPVVVNGCEGWWNVPDPESRYCRSLSGFESSNADDSV